MFHYECDWCGEQIDVQREPLAKVEIKIVTLERDHRGKRDEETEPSRFFHVSPLRSRDEWDRLGIAPLFGTLAELVSRATSLRLPQQLPPPDLQQPAGLRATTGSANGVGANALTRPWPSPRPRAESQALERGSERCGRRCLALIERVHELRASLDGTSELAVDLATLAARLERRRARCGGDA